VNLGGHFSQFLRIGLWQSRQLKCHLQYNVSAHPDRCSAKLGDKLISNCQSHLVPQSCAEQFLCDIGMYPRFGEVEKDIEIDCKKRWLNTGPRWH